MFHPLPLAIGLRYVRSRKRSYFVSFITWASLAGLCLGVAALITILSIMNGFELELRARLVSVAAHATLTGDAAALADWRSAVERTRRLAATTGISASLFHN